MASQGKMLLSFIVPHRDTEPVKKTCTTIHNVMRSLKCAYEIIAIAGNHPSVQRNKAVKQAKGRYLYFLDNDSILARGSVERALELMEKDPRIAAVGGPSLTPETDSYWQRAFGTALSSMFAVGPRIRSRYSRRGKPRQTDEFEIILANLAIRRNAFLEAGGFNERLYPNEENVLINTILSKGHQVWYHPGMVVFRSQRKNYSEFLSQMLTYGRGRADETFAQNKFSLAMFIPFMFALYAFSFIPIWLGVHNPAIRLILVLPGALYVIGLGLFTLSGLFRAKSIIYLPVLPLLFFTVHLFYGLGILRGTFLNLPRKGKRHTKKIWFKIERIK
jgi:succinoglycan biosynthesis protein ExoA